MPKFTGLQGKLMNELRCGSGLQLRIKQIIMNFGGGGIIKNINSYIQGPSVVIIEDR